MEPGWAVCSHLKEQAGTALADVSNTRLWAETRAPQSLIKRVFLARETFSRLNFQRGVSTYLGIRSSPPNLLCDLKGAQRAGRPSFATLVPA